MPVSPPLGMSGQEDEKLRVILIYIACSQGQMGYLRPSVKQTLPEKNSLSLPPKQLLKPEGSQGVLCMLLTLPLGGAIRYL